ncbi:hypothetical protein [Embleya sp. NBC_00896]|uniref:deazapurine DNA modification protein DpdA family protein n=1 Tax=Embleya sp. NBC_00896 TaxID=2975961 RepID=UPI00386E083A|nr:hypothetical protein OG928_48355 [Embleya sp. NBC_00896]
MRFYLGTHMPHWLDHPRIAVPLFVSHRRLAARRTLPRARVPWALDSGAFTELSLFGGWETTAARYVAAVRRYHDEIGLLDWAAPMDWPCEPHIVHRTGLSVRRHQENTVDNYLALRAAAPEVSFVPVLQGWDLDDYVLAVSLYERAGVDLTTLPLVAVGSVCRRQATREIGTIVETLAGIGIPLHGFGVKARGLRAYAPRLASADSMAWSYSGRHRPGCAPSHRSESNCMTYALAWRARLLSTTG